MGQRTQAIVVYNAPEETLHKVYHKKDSKWKLTPYPLLRMMYFEINGSDPKPHLYDPHTIA